MATENKILILGPTGAIGRHIVWASIKAGNPTYALVRKTPGNVNKPKLITAANPETKEELIDNYQSLGVILLEGDINDHETLVKAIKQVDIVICAAGRLLIEDQVKIIKAIKEAGNVKKFFPSEFGLDVDRHEAVEPVRQVFEEKASIRRVIESEGVPYTYLCCHAFTGYFLRNLAQLDATDPPRDKVVILGDGNVKGAYVTEADVGTFTIRAANDPNTLNKAVHIRLPKNYLTQNEVIALWEKKIGKTLEKTYVSEEQVLKDIQAAQANVHDRWRWMIDPAHGYSVKGTYQFLTMTDVPPERGSAVEVWHKQAPLKVSLFAWRLFRNRLPTKDNLLLRHVLHSDNIACVGGCGSSETAEHLFIGCAFFGRVWTLVLQWLGLSFVAPVGCRDHYLQFGHMAESSFPHNYLLALYHSQQIKGDAVYEIDPAKDIEASEAYPDVTYTTADEYLNQFV